MDGWMESGHFILALSQEEKTDTSVPQFLSQKTQEARGQGVLAIIVIHPHNAKLIRATVG
jgi:hypothetical protein